MTPLLLEQRNVRKGRGRRKMKKDEERDKGGQREGSGSRA